MKTTIPPITLGIDLGDRKHEICVVDKHAEPVKRFSITNLRESIERLAEDYPGARIAMEAGTHSPWISRILKDAGMEVLVANARKLRAIYTNERKSDEADAEIIARLARLDPKLLHPVEHGCDQAQRELLCLKGRDTLVRQRVNIIASVRGMLKSLGFRLPSSGTAYFVGRARPALGQHPDILVSIEPSLCAIEQLTVGIREYDGAIDKLIKESYPQARKLQQIQGVGPITALCFVLVIGDPKRFKDPRDVAAYLGMVPRRDQSGSVDKELGISKTGNACLRRLLVQCAHYITGRYGPDSDLRRHGLKLIERGGSGAKKKARVAVARKLAVVMLVLWKNGSDYREFNDRLHPHPHPQPSPQKKAA